MQVEAGVAQQPLVDGRGLVSGVVVQDQVQRRAGTAVSMSSAKKRSELLGAVAAG